MIVYYVPFSQHPITELLSIGKHGNCVGDYLHLLNKTQQIFKLCIGKYHKWYKVYTSNTTKFVI